MADPTTSIHWKVDIHLCSCWIRRRLDRHVLWTEPDQTRPDQVRQKPRKQLRWRRQLQSACVFQNIKDHVHIDVSVCLNLFLFFFFLYASGFPPEPPLAQLITSNCVNIVISGGAAYEDEGTKAAVTATVGLCVYHSTERLRKMSTNKKPGGLAGKMHTCVSPRAFRFSWQTKQPYTNHVITYPTSLSRLLEESTCLTGAVGDGVKKKHFIAAGSNSQNDETLIFEKPVRVRVRVVTADNVVVPFTERSSILMSFDTFWRLILIYLYSDHLAWCSEQY